MHMTYSLSDWRADISYKHLYLHFELNTDAQESDNIALCVLIHI